MSRSILVDTDVLIDFLRGHEPAVSFVESNADRIILSSIVVAELYACVRGGEKDRERTVLENFLSLFRVVPVSRDIAKLGGLYKRDYGRSHGAGIADAISIRGACSPTAQGEGAKSRRSISNGAGGWITSRKKSACRGLMR